MTAEKKSDNAEGDRGVLKINIIKSIAKAKKETEAKNRLMTCRRRNYRYTTEDTKRG